MLQHFGFYVSNIDNMKLLVHTLILFALLAGCKSQKAISRVEEVKSNFVMPELKSTINVHYELENKTVRDTFNTVIDTYLAGDMELEAMGMDVTISKEAEAEIEFSGRRVLTRLPIRIGLAKSTFINNINAQGVLDLRFITDMDIDSNWQLVTKTRLEYFEWLEKPELSLGVFKVSIGKLADNIITRSKGELEAQIDKSVNDQFSIRAMILDVMKQVEKPIQIDTILNSYVSLKPENVYLQDFFYQRDYTVGNITIQGTTKISETPFTEDVPGLKLPHFKWEDSLDDTSHINLVFDIGYQQINDYLNQNYTNKRFSSGDKEIVVKSMDIRRNADKLEIEADVTGTLNGTIVISGKPIFDNKRQVFYTDDIDIHVKTKNVLHKAGAWLLKSKIKNQLKALMTFSLDENIGTIQDLIDKEIRKYNNDQRISLRADLNNFNIDRFALDQDRIHTFLTINMYLEAKIHDMRIFNDGSTVFKLRG